MFTLQTTISYEVKTVRNQWLFTITETAFDKILCMNLYMRQRSEDNCDGSQIVIISFEQLLKLFYYIKYNMTQRIKESTFSYKRLCYSLYSFLRNYKVYQLRLVIFAIYLELFYESRTQGIDLWQFIIYFYFKSSLKKYIFLIYILLLLECLRYCKYFSTIYKIWLLL